MPAVAAVSNAIWKCQIAQAWRNKVPTINLNIKYMSAQENARYGTEPGRWEVAQDEAAEEDGRWARGAEDTYIEIEEAADAASARWRWGVGGDGPTVA